MGRPTWRRLTTGLVLALIATSASGGCGGNARGGNGSQGAGGGGAAAPDGGIGGGDVRVDATTSTGGHVGDDAGMEDCMNNIDDDGDGAVDCADSACDAGFMCVESAPPGWTGPVVLYEGPGGEPTPLCGDWFPTAVFAGGANPQAEEAECSECSCGAPIAPFTCDYWHRLNVYCNAACDGQLTSGSGGSIASCEDTSLVDGCDGARASAILVAVSYSPDAPWTGVTCTPSEQAPTLPPASWDIAAAACGTSRVGAGGCAAGSICSPRPAEPYLLRACIANTTGDEECPPGAYSEKHSFGSAIDDTRGCTPCACGPALGACDMTWEIREGADCGGAVVLSGSGEQCIDAEGLPDAISVLYQGGTPTGGGACNPDPVGSVPMGTVATADHVTICCAP